MLRLNISVQVLNFFTVSSYGPRAFTDHRASITWLRATEDRRALALLNDGITFSSLALLDAPIRFGMDWREVFRSDNQRLLSDDGASDLAGHIRRNVGSSLVLAPLALGDHIDHVAVRNAALRNARFQSSVAFYEDLPYAMWASEHSIRSRIQAVEAAYGNKLRAYLVRMPRAAASKRRAAVRYATQITSREASAIARSAVAYGASERLWAPQYSSKWRWLAALR